MALGRETHSGSNSDVMWIESRSGGSIQKVYQIKLLAWLMNSLLTEIMYIYISIYYQIDYFKFLHLKMLYIRVKYNSFHLLIKQILTSTIKHYNKLWE